MANYYAVKVGKVPGVYTTWPEAQQQIVGFSGALFKKFATKKDAEEFIASDEKEENTVFNGPKYYTDGSYNAKKQLAGWAWVLVINDYIEHSKFGSNSDKEWSSSYQIIGEVVAVLEAVEDAIHRKFKEIEINYDYQGIESWALNDWQTKSKVAIYYVEELRKKANHIDIYFNKVKAHTGDPFNEEADLLAKAGADLV